MIEVIPSRKCSCDYFDATTYDNSFGTCMLWEEEEVVCFGGCDLRTVGTLGFMIISKP